jgi:O-antigen/teichoic acid export membrane protein
MTMGTHALGLYQFAKRIAELPIATFTRAVGQVALPALSGPHANEALSRTWRTMLAWLLAVNTAAAIVILIFGDTAVAGIAGLQWLPAVPVLRILAVAMLFRAVVILTGQMLDARGRPSLTLQLNAVRLGTLLVVLPPLAAWGGLHGIAQAVVLSSAAGAILAIRLSGRVLSETPWPG